MDLNYKAIYGAPIAWSDNLFNEKELGTIYEECVTIREKGLLSKDRTRGATRNGVELDRKSVV